MGPGDVGGPSVAGEEGGGKERQREEQRMITFSVRLEEPVQTGSDSSP